MRKENKKKPSDYGIFAFRIDDQTKEKLNKLIEKVVELENSKLNLDHKAIRKNDVIIEALEKGLAMILRKYQK